MKCQQLSLFLWRHPSTCSERCVVALLLSLPALPSGTKIRKSPPVFSQKRRNALRTSPGNGSRVSSKRHCQIQRGNQEREGKMAIFSSVKSLRNEVWRQLLSEGFFHPIHQLPPPFPRFVTDGHVRLEWEGAIHHRASLSPFPSQFPRFPLSIPCARILQHCCVQEE